MPETVSREPFEIAGVSVSPGKRISVDIPLPKLYTHLETTMPVEVLHGKKDGPILFVCAAIHGDEINGVEIIRRLLKMKILKNLRGTLLAVPVVNVFGFIETSRYSPDRRDLNRMFPGNSGGSLTSQLADAFISEIVSKCTHGIDLHTGSNHRTNLPQLRVCLDEEGIKEMAVSFAAPIILDSALIDGSLRGYAAKKNIPMIVYEGGEPLRYDERVIQIGLRGVINVMRSIGMLTGRKDESEVTVNPVIARSSTWVRASQSGILFFSEKVGKAVRKGDVIGRIADPFGNSEAAVEASVDGVIIGKTTLPLVHRGDACFHIAETQQMRKYTQAIRDIDGLEV